jgi:tetratricopeptide (TPR) repeat protein
LGALYQYPYQLTKENNGYQISKILSTKEIYCVWFALIGHAFLQELGIKHQWLYMPWHVAIAVDITGDTYYFDAVRSKRVLHLKMWEQKGKYRMIKLTGELGTMWPTEDILLSSIYNNKWNVLVDLWNKSKGEEAMNYYQWALAMHDETLKLHPFHLETYHNKWNVFYSLWRKTQGKEAIRYYEQALTMYDKALELNPDFRFYNNKWNILYALWNKSKGEKAMNYYEQALAMYDKALELNPASFETYERKWDVFNYLWCISQGKEKIRYYQQALAMYDKVLELNPDDTFIKSNIKIIQNILNGLLPPSFLKKFLNKFKT